MAVEDELVGQILLGKLEVLRKIGGGGMGVVYEVEHRLTGHRRALKVVHATFADRPRFMKRLLREAKVAGTLKTPYVVETYDAGRLEDGSAYVLMELLHGQSLYELLQDEGRLPTRRLAEIMTQVAEGMAVAHEAGIVHRDLKPENVFLTPGEDGIDRVKILDFGVSKFEPQLTEVPTRLTIEGTLVGTPYYMSPEQSAGREIDVRTDLYAMGVMMYEALSGRLPFEADTVGALFIKIGAGECVPLRIRRTDLDEKWCELVHKAFDRDPEKRFQTAEEMRIELVKMLEGGSTAARARTISDGARTSAAPVHATEPVSSEEPLTEPAQEAQALAPPPAAPNKRAFPGWAWAVAGAAFVAIVAVGWRLAREGTEESARTEDRPPAAPIEEREIASPPPPDLAPEQPPPIAQTIDAGAPIVEATDPPRPRDRAQSDGLDRNPYRRRP
jgi:serine/threonine protein kinase